MADQEFEHDLRLDVETYSSVDLLKCGHHAYADSPDFQIMLLAYQWDTGPVEIVDLMAGEKIPAEVELAIRTGRRSNGARVRCKAFNAAFETTCFAAHFQAEIQLDHWYCTSVHAMFCGLPNSLMKVSEALGLPVNLGKASTGRSLIKFFCVPQKPTRKNGMRTRNLPQHDLARWDLFKEYCRQDVVAEHEVDKRVSKVPLPDVEHRAWVMDQRINARGLLIDMELVEAAIAKGKEHRDRLLAEAARITGLSNANSVQQLKNWLLEIEEIEDDDIPKLDKKTVPKLLEALRGHLGVDEGEVVIDFDLEDAAQELAEMEARESSVGNLPQRDVDAFYRRLRLIKAVRVLQLRLEIAKASVKKFDAMKRARCRDGRVRGSHQFYGANRTGRWAAKIVQTQNMRSNNLPDMALARRMIKEWTIEQAEAYNWAPRSKKGWFVGYSELLSQCVRTAIIPDSGKVFVVCDFSAIEAVKLAWLANEEWRLEVFRTHGKIYETSASLAFRIPMAEIEAYHFVHGKHHPIRKKGKVLELACGYGGSTGALINMGALDQGIDEGELPGMVAAWRDASPNVKTMWWDIDRAFRAVLYGATPDGNSSVVANLPQYKVRLFRRFGTVFIQLPSGRCLSYLGAHINENDEIAFYGVDQKTKRWGRLTTYGPKLVENIDQASSRDCLRDTMLDLEPQIDLFGAGIVMHVHDELVMEVTAALAETIKAIALRRMGAGFSWAPGLPLKAAGYITPFYAKDD